MDKFGKALGYAIATIFTFAVIAVVLVGAYKLIVWML